MPIFVRRGRKIGKMDGGEGIRTSEWILYTKHRGVVRWRIEMKE